MNPSRCLILAATLLLAAPRSFSADTPDAHAVKAVVAHFQEAWNRHDIDQLAALMAEEVVFIHTRGGRLNTRKEFKDYHVELHQVVMAKSALSTQGVDVKFIRPDLAVVHWDWALQDDRDRDGTARPPREGIFTWLLERRDASWLIIDAQNTNKAPPSK